MWIKKVGPPPPPHRCLLPSYKSCQNQGASVGSEWECLHCHNKWTIDDFNEEAMFWKCFYVNGDIKTWVKYK